jgi:glutathione synthase/RimK-type ligase-like ATP-grasp enzyme
MILIITHKDDLTVDFVVKELNERQIKYYRLNCEDILVKNNIIVSINEKVQATINGISDFDSIWFRRTKYPDLSEFDYEIRKYCYVEIDFFLTNLWLTVNTKRWMSRPTKVYLAENKLLQLGRAKELGFNVPETIVTGNNSAIRDFFYAMKGNLIIKPLFQNRVFKDGSEKLIFTNQLSVSDLSKIEKRLPLPSVYQRYIDKVEEYRITVVDNNTFCASVDSQSDRETTVDWRRKKLKFTPAEVSSQIKTKCIELVHDFGLSFGAIDLVKDKNDEFFFLELNPNGQWAWIEVDTGLKITDSIIDYLTNAQKGN